MINGDIYSLWLCTIILLVDSASNKINAVWTLSLSHAGIFQRIGVSNTSGTRSTEVAVKFNINHFLSHITDFLSWFSPLAFSRTSRISQECGVYLIPTNIRSVFKKKCNLPVS